MKTLLVVKDGPSAGVRIEPTSDTLIGRVGADVSLDDPKVSRRHAMLRSSQRGIEIEDLASTNGTWVNGRRIESRALLSSGDLVKVGDTFLEVVGEALNHATVIDSRVENVGEPVPAFFPSWHPEAGAATAAAPPAAASIPPRPPPATSPTPAPPAVGTARAPSARSGLRGSVASRRPAAAVASIAVIVLTAAALVSYFALR